MSRCISFLKQTLIVVLVTQFVIPTSVLAQTSAAGTVQQVHQALGGEISPELRQQWDQQFEAWAEQRLEEGEEPLTYEQKAQLFNGYIEALQRSAFAQESADPDARYFTHHPLDVFELLGQTIPEDIQYVIDRAHSRNAKAALNPENTKDPENPYLRLPVISRDKVVVEILNEQGHETAKMAASGANVEGIFGDLGLRKPQWNHPSSKGLYTFRLSSGGDSILETRHNITGLVVAGPFLVFI